MNSPELRQTPLHGWHTANGGRMVDFAGWSMPVQYRSIVDEHVATRTACSLFDVSHMGRFLFRGTNGDSMEVAAFLDRIVTRRVTDLKPGRIRYALVANEQGGILDDVLVYHLDGPSGQGAPNQGTWQMVVNASNREKIATVIRRHLSESRGERAPASGHVEFLDQTERTCMIAVQGPRALELAELIVGQDLRSMPFYTGQVLTAPNGSLWTVSRTGYTGEDGCEIIAPAVEAVSIWESLMDHGQTRGVAAAGLGARDTLRLEAAMPLYGHELSESIDPYQAGLAFAVNLEGRQFCGRDALARLKQRRDGDQDAMIRVGLEVAGRRAPREHYPVLAAGVSVGEVTSGTYSPTLGKSIAMAYVPQRHASTGDLLQVDIRGKQENATCVSLPFYSRSG
ncbi:MAG: glycine cleavage system aminomethyltransferase GcvT [Pirellulaceae bacterium]